MKSGAVRTSLDLALDLQAFQRRLNQQQEEINRLKELKRRLEESKLKGNFFLFKIKFLESIRKYTMKLEFFFNSGICNNMVG